MKLTKVLLSDLVPDDNNARTHSEKNLKEIKRSLVEFGQHRPFVVQKDTNKVIVGNGMLEAMQDLGMTEGFVYFVDDDKETAIRRALADNRTGELAEWHEDVLAELLEELGGINAEVPGFSEDEINEILKNVEVEGLVEEDEVPELKDDPVSKLGDIWLLGEHRLMCGDSTDKETVKLLMNGNKADIAFSSPPYNAGTTATETAMGKTTKYNGNEDNKSEAEYIDFLNAYIEQAIEHCEYVFMNVQQISNNKFALIDVLYHNKEIYADTVIWDKIHGQPAMAENVMNSVFEYVHIFSKKANRAVGTVPFRGTVDNILHLQSQRKNKYSNIHNATFSVEFASYFIRNFAKESVLDQFGGTGTTLIACEKTNRKCYMMELDPQYVDVIINRWQNYTGKEAILEQGGKTYNELRSDIDG